MFRTFFQVRPRFRFIVENVKSKGFKMAVAAFSLLAFLIVGPRGTFSNFGRNVVKRIIKKIRAIFG